jgi:hypothetical protein
MSRRNLFASILMACLLAAGLGGFAPVANAASAGQSFLNAGESAGNNVIKIKRRSRGPRIIPPIAPSYLAYDYPYYYSRGHYPRHIGPGYIHHFLYYRPAYHPKYGGRCSKWHRRCAGNWGHRNEDYRGCMDYHRCR